MGFAEGGDVHSDAMSDLLNNPVKVSQLLSLNKLLKSRKAAWAVR